MVKKYDLGASNGKVLKLHFACHAELPYGSSLRVTASNSLFRTAAAEKDSVSTSNQSGGEGNDESDSNSIYASSVEMVTSPDEYPVWRTRTPVICVINNASVDGIFQHRYRYLVVTPGACKASFKGDGNYGLKSDSEGDRVDITVWENPFKNKQTCEQGTKEVRFEKKFVYFVFSLLSPGSNRLHQYTHT